MNDREGILLESGTNEVEMLEFQLDGQGFGVNVLKVQAIEQYDPSKVTNIQLAHEAVIGTYLFRDGVITLVDLNKDLAMMEDNGSSLAAEQVAAVQAVMDATPEDLGMRPDLDAENDEEVLEESSTGMDIETRIVLVLEFNEVITGFLVGGVQRIHRVSWDAISPLSPYLSSLSSKFTGSLNIENREILVVDMERIVSEILPGANKEFQVEELNDEQLAARRGAIPVLLAEDSGTIRAVVTKELHRGGYAQVESFDNGASCYEAIERIVEKARAEGRSPRDYIGAIITDIEMPSMDGMTLCRRTKKDLGLKDIPVILFSSLINEQTGRKCESVGADGFLSKPRFNELVSMLDKHTLV